MMKPDSVDKYLAPFEWAYERLPWPQHWKHKLWLAGVFLVANIVVPVVLLYYGNPLLSLAALPFQFCFGWFAGRLIGTASNQRLKCPER